MSSAAGHEQGIIDTHVHAWDAVAVHHSWLDESPDLPRQPRLPSPQQRQRAGVTGLILVEAGADRPDALAERAQMLRLAGDASHGIRGIVSPAALEDEPAGAPPEAVRGIRVNLRGVHVDEAVAVLRRALARAAGHRWAVDVVCSAHELEAVAAAVRQTGPTPPLVIDHLGAPPVTAGTHAPEWREWQGAMTTLAGMSHVVVKLSGHPLGPVTRDAVRWVVDRFGSERCLLGSDWPISESAAYGSWFDEVAHALGSLDDELRHGTARRTYSVGDGAERSRDGRT